MNMMNPKNIFAGVVIIVIVPTLILTLNQSDKKPTLLPVSTLPTAISTLETQTNSEGSISVQVTPKLTSETVFEITLDTHSEELLVDLVPAATLEDETGKEYKPKRWAGDPPGGHHREGMLIFNQIAPPPKILQLTIRQIVGVPERRFKWTIKS
ncbi:MAG TPA: hypothetical protein VJL36_03015 [Candidatus Paceibacterota bacterium]